jgi:hypothetical protein
MRTIIEVIEEELKCRMKVEYIINLFSDIEKLVRKAEKAMNEMIGVNDGVKMTNEHTAPRSNHAEDQSGLQMMLRRKTKRQKIRC